MKQLAIIGASGHGKVVAELAELCGFKVVFYDDAYPHKKNIEHWLVVGKFSCLLTANDKDQDAIVAIGDNKIRLDLSEQLMASGFTLPVLVHPCAVISKYATVDSGTVVFANAVINAFSQVGKSCIINTAAVVEHDCRLGDAVHLSPNVALAGGTRINRLSWLGIGTVTKQLIEVGSNVSIGANSTVIKNIPDNVKAFGSPAEVINNKHLK